MEHIPYNVLFRRKTDLVVKSTCQDSQINFKRLTRKLILIVTFSASHQDLLSVQSDIANLYLLMVRFGWASVVSEVQNSVYQGALLDQLHAQT
jgi:hypothetical protein